ncbi:tyrosine-type recombinase/integrase [Kribbella sp. CA-294648]|uniref:tyrosine-type recombinase/integrase n=1 Tax=Kribbella sp. CA-294648 TaxID=3239948 RepID=UPI003D945530
MTRRGYGGLLAARCPYRARSHGGVRGTEPGPPVLAVNKGGRIDPARGRLSTSALYGIVQRRAAAAGIAKFSPHDGRRTFAGELLDAGADLAAVHQLMGHARAAS